MKGEVTAEMLRALTRELAGFTDLVTLPRQANDSVHQTASKAATNNRAFKDSPPETPEEIAKLDSALAVLSPDALRGQGKLYEPGGGVVSGDYWLLVVWAIASLGWKCGKQKARDWSMRMTRQAYSEQGFEDAWNSYNPHHPNAVGIGSLYKLAAELGWQAPQVSVSSLAANDSRYQLLTPSAIYSLPTTAWRVKHVLPSAGLAAIYGPSGSGKSFLAMDLAAAIAKGATWFGHKCHTAPVVYVMLEGVGGLRNRVSALERAKGSLPEQFMVLAQPFQLTTAQDVADLGAIIPPGAVVFIDTLNRAAPTSDENSSKEMGAILEAAKQLQIASGGLIVAVHHTGKDPSKGMRGHSSLHAALDAAIEVTRTPQARSWHLAKAKDGEDGKALAFKLIPHVLGVDDDGEGISSCSVEQDLAAVFAKPEPQGRNQRIALQAIRDFVKDSIYTVTGRIPAAGASPCAQLDGVIAAVERAISTTPQNKRWSEAKRLVRALIDGGYVDSVEDDGDTWCWLP